jgi:hypothetical protein
MVQTIDAVASFLAMTKFNKLKANQNHEKNTHPIHPKPYHIFCADCQRAIKIQSTGGSLAGKGPLEKHFRWQGVF